MLNTFTLFMLAAAGTSVILMICAISTHSSERAFFLIFSSICTFLYTMGYFLEITSPTLESAFIGVRVQKMGTPLLVVFNYLFIRDIYGEKRFSFLRYCLIFAIPLLNMFTAEAFPLVRLHYTRIEYFFNGYFANCQGFPGPMSYLANAYNLFLAFLSIRCILRHLKKGSPLLKRQSLCLLASVLIPLAAYIYHILSYNHLRLDLPPLAVSISLIPLLYSIQTQNLLNVVPVARDQIIESMADAFIVCGKDFGFLDANRAARNLFPELDRLLPGETMERAKQLNGESELALQIDGEMRFYKITQTAIQQNRKSNVSGICIVLHDITEKENQLKRLYKKATFDPLMHIYNRATFFDLARFMLNTGDAKNRHWILLMIDLDCFKLVNDTYGHSGGDTALQTIARIVKGHLRKYGIVGRYGGEEIVVLLEEVSAGQAILLADGLRADIEKTVISFQDKKIPITVSIGITHSPAGRAHSLEDMLEQADSALYQAKSRGRNQVCLYGNQQTSPHA